MKKKCLLLILFCIATILLVNKFFPKFKNYSKKQNLSQDSIFFSEKNISKKVASDSSDIIKPYERQMPSRYVDKHDIVKIISANNNTLSEISKKINSSAPSEVSKYSFRNKDNFWNLNLEPQDDEEFQLAISEAQILSIRRLTNASLNNDLETMKLYAAAYQGFQFLKSFELTKDENNKIILIIKGWSEFVKNEQNKFLSGQLASINQSRFYFTPSDKMNRTITKDEIVKEQVEAQTAFYSDIAGSEERRKNFSSAKSNMKELFSAFEYLANISSIVPIVKSTAEELYDLNHEIIRNTIIDIKSYPDRYGYTISQARQINSMLDVPIELFVKEIINNRATTTALWGGGISATISGTMLAKMLGKFRATGLMIFTSLGFEPMFMSIGTYQGLKQLYVFQRIYAYAWSQKFLLKNEFCINETLEKFDVSSILFGETFNQLALKAWSTGIAAGFLIKGVFSPAGVSGWTYRKLVKNSGISNFLDYSYVYLGTKFLDKKSIYSGTIKNFVKKFSSSSGQKWLVTASFPRNTFSRYLLKPFVNLFRKFNILKFITPGGIALTGIDFAITSMSLYVAVDTILRYSSKSITGVYENPGTSIQLALFDSSGYNKNFHSLTRQIFYPLCAIHAIGSRNIHTGFDPAYNKILQKNCMTLIMKLEDFNIEDRIKENFPKVYQTITIEKKQQFSKEVYYELLERASSAPEPYKIFWLAALRSIYDLKYIPPLYWETRDKIIHGFGTFRNYSFLDPIKVATKMNLDRLVYSIELISVKHYMKKNPEIKEKTDPSIAGNVKNEIDAFIKYVDYNRAELFENKKELQKYEKNLENLKTVNALSSTIVDSFSQLASKIYISINEFRRPPRDWRYDVLLDNQIIEIENKTFFK